MCINCEYGSRWYGINVHPNPTPWLVFPVISNPPLVLVESDWLATVFGSEADGRIPAELIDFLPGSST